MVSFPVLYPITATHSLWNKTSWNTHSNALVMSPQPAWERLIWLNSLDAFFVSVGKWQSVKKEDLWERIMSEGLPAQKKILREKPLVWQNIILRKFVSESSLLNLSSHDSMLPCPTEAAILKSSAAESHTYFPKSIHPGKATQWLQYQSRTQKTYIPFCTWYTL